MHLFFLFFILSGFCSLVYQVAWLRIAMADFGVTSTTIAVVLSVFMAGLSFGSWGGGRLAVRTDSPAGSQLRLYGVLEGVIGLSALVSVPLLGYGQSLLAKSAGMEWGSGAYYLASGSIIFIVLFPFCSCMGATFPIAMAAVKRSYPEKASTSFSYLYLANLLGAVLGCAGTAFVLIELLGFRGSMLISGAINFAIALAAFVKSGRHSLSLKEDSQECTEASELPVPLPAGRMAYAVLLLTGMVSMALEVVWSRQFTPFLGPVVYTFATILVIFLVASFAGSRFYRRKCGHPLLFDQALTLRVMLAVTGLAAMLPLLTADYRLPLPDGILGGAIRVAAGIAPFGFMLGFITPWVVDRLSSGEPGRAGVAYSVNTTGCILGPLMAGFLLLPFVGERWSTFLLATPFFLLSLLFASRHQESDRHKYFSPVLAKWTLFAALSCSGLLVILTKDFEKKYPDAVILRDHTATVVAAGEGMNRQLLVNGYGMTVLTPITKMMVHLPLALHASPPKNGLVLCFGMGTSFRSMLSWEIPTTVVELVPSIPKLVGFFHADARNLMADPNARIVVDDARRFLNRTSERFDVIVLDPPPPIEAAASSLLYSREFYQSVVVRLNDGGIFQQWTDTSDPYLCASIVSSLTEVFPFVRVFNSYEGWGMHCVASMHPIPNRSPAELAAILRPRAAADLVEWGPSTTTTVQQFEDVLSREQDISELLKAAPLARAIEDDRPVNEYFLLRRLLRRVKSWLKTV
jgi:spermidine synthase